MDFIFHEKNFSPSWKKKILLFPADNSQDPGDITCRVYLHEVKDVMILVYVCIFFF